MVAISSFTSPVTPQRHTRTSSKRPHATAELSNSTRLVPVPPQGKPPTLSPFVAPENSGRGIPKERKASKASQSIGETTPPSDI